LFIINNPDVYKSPSSDTYVIFGDAKIEDISNPSVEKAVEELEELQTQDEKVTTTPEENDKDSVEPQENKESDEDLDETGVEPKDVELVMAQAGCTKNAAIKALKENNGDIVNAIMVSYISVIQVLNNLNLQNVMILLYL